MKKASPQTGRVKVTSLHGFIYENAARSPDGWQLFKSHNSFNSQKYLLRNFKGNVIDSFCPLPGIVKKAIEKVKK